MRKKVFLHCLTTIFLILILVFPLITMGQGRDKIKVGDVVSIRVEKEPHLNARETVSSKGVILYRSLGEVYVDGMSSSEVARKIESLIKRYYPFLQNPKVRVEVEGIQFSNAADNEDIETIGTESFVAQAETVYRISAHDTIEVSVFGEPDLTKILRVSQDGIVRYPLIGEVAVEGLTEEDLRIKIEDLLKSNYFVNPKVGVFIVEYAKFSILGEIKRPGTFELKGRINLVDAFVLAEGPLEHANLSKVKIFRSHGEEKGKEKQYIINLEKEGKIFYLKPADRVVIEAKGKIYILGAVHSPGIYHIKEEEISLADALSFLAGGTTSSAKLSNIEIIRKNERGDNVTYNVELEEQGDTFFLLEKDRIVVKSYGNISVFGQVASPGRYPFSKGLTTVDALALAGGFTNVAARNGVRVIRKQNGEKKTIKVPVGYILSTGDSSRDVELEDGDTVVVPESWF